MQKSLLSATGILILGGILLLVNSISTGLFSRFYFDLTDEGLYSLSPGTKKILEKIENPVTLRYYFSRTDSAKYPGAKLYADRVEDLLKQYQRIGKGKVTLEVSDPRPDSEEEEWASKYGLTPMNLPTGESLFFGLAGTNALGEEESIPVFNLQRQEFLEYDITRLVDSLGNPKKTVVGVISPLKIQGEASQQPQNPMAPPPPDTDPWILASQLKRLGDVKYLGTDVSEIDKAISVLVVIHPKNLPEQTRYAIDQFAVKGGKLFVAVDPYCAADTTGADPNNPMAAMFADRSSSLDLLAGWGVKSKGKEMAIDMNLATPVNSGRGQAPENFVAWLSLNSSVPSGDPIINQDDVATANLENILLPWPGSLELVPTEGLTETVLLRTTKDAMSLDEQQYRFSAQNPGQMLRDYKSGGQSLILAAKITGKLKSNFKNKPGAEGEATMSTAGGHIPMGSEEGTIVVVADVDFLSDQYSAAVQNFMGTKLVSLLNDNLNLAANAVENLAGSNDLISLRSRGAFIRPFTRVREIEAEAQQRWQAEEQTLQAKLNEANRRLSELQAGGNSQEGKAVFSEAILDEVKRFRSEKGEAQSRLREVRRNLRQDKERLGNILFLLNSFLVPAVLIAMTLYKSLNRSRRKKSSAAPVHAETAATGAE